MTPAGSVERYHCLPPRVLVALLIPVLYLVFVGSAMAISAPSFADACGSANNLDYAVCERLDYIANSQYLIAQESEDSTRYLGWAVGAIVFISVAPVLMRTVAREI